MSQKSILVIEDHREVRENIAEILELANYAVETASNGKEGIKMALYSPPDLVICDIMMPELDGYEVLYLLTKNPKTASLPFIFLTAKAEKTDFRKGMNMGADDYITKPFEELELLGSVERRLQKFEELSKANDIDDLITSASNYKSLETLEKERKTQVYKKRDIIYREDDHSSYVYKIRMGKVKTYRINEDGKELVLNILKEGDFLGEQSLIQDTSRTEFAEAIEDTELIQIPREDFQKLIFSNREVSGHLIKLISKNLSNREDELMEMAYNTVRKRTADNLLKLYEAFRKEETPVTFDISRTDLAGMVGSSPESVIRILAEFKKDKWIETVGGVISVLEPERIAQVKF
ncbi:MAG: response regulator [Cyclobacteriaceae bacterium]